MLSVWKCGPEFESQHSLTKLGLVMHICDPELLQGRGAVCEGVETGWPTSLVEMESSRLSERDLPSEKKLEKSSADPRSHLSFACSCTGYLFVYMHVHMQVHASTHTHTHKLKLLICSTTSTSAWSWPI